MSEQKIKVGIVGAAGYTAGELIRILMYHPDVTITGCQSNSQAGKKVFETHKDLIGETSLEFTESIDFTNTDVIFLCKGHGESKKYLESTQVPTDVKIVDLSHDYRLKVEGNEFLYGLPELNLEGIKESNYVANPGCFATCLQLGLLPAAQAGIIESDVHSSGITGSTGAGQALSSTTHFTWRNNNLSVYKAFVHQHLGEIKQSLAQLNGGKVQGINFIPYRGDFTRGIIITSYFKSNTDMKKVKEIYSNFYQSAAFTHLVDQNPDLKQVVNTNKALVYLEQHDEHIMVISVIDNLLKGASGQAVQNMNIMFGLPQDAGLKLKSVAF
ncbi:MAG: N-acetyl-gamma-glutamyl-phosphate reductase [bacterium]|nr:N-acetyl-gamma-glutamyl-phosphate reductase [bacterium]